MPASSRPPSAPTGSSAQPLVSRLGIVGRTSLDTAHAPSPPLSNHAPRHQQLPLDVLITTLTSSPDVIYALQLADLLSNGESVDVAQIFPPISLLCSASQSPATRSAGYLILRNYCSSQPRLDNLQRRAFWKALCSAGPSWTIEASSNRAEALSQLIGDASNIDGFDGLMDEVKNWMASALDASSSTPNEAQDREHFLDMLNSFVIRVTLNNPLLRLEQQVSGLLEVYSSWVDRALREHYRQSHSSVAPRLHSRQISSVGSTTLNSIMSDERSRPSFNTSSVMFLNLVEVYLKEAVLVPLQVLPEVISTLCFLLGQTMRALPPGQGARSNISDSLEDRATMLLHTLFDSKWYSSTSIRSIKRLLLPTSSSNSPQIAAGAMRAVRLALNQHLRSLMDREKLSDMVAMSSNPSGAPAYLAADFHTLAASWSKSSDGGLSLPKIGGSLRDIVKPWRSQDGKEDVLMELAGLVSDVLTFFPNDSSSDIARFAGETIQELSALVKDYRSPDGSTHRLRLASVSAAPTPLLNCINDLLRMPMDQTITKPSLSSILLSIADHLNDSDAMTIIRHLHQSGQLGPGYPEWASNFRILIGSFYANSRAYPRSRKLISTLLAKLYEEITDLESFRLEIVEDMIAMWETSLPSETNEDILQAAFEVMSKEIVLSTMAEEEEANPLAQRIKNTWVRVAVQAPPYYEGVILPTNPQSPLNPASTPQITTPAVDSHPSRYFHPTTPSLAFNFPNGSPAPSFSEPPTPSTETSLPILTPPRPGRGVLAVMFLINAFNKLAFRSPQSLKILLSDASRRQSASAATMAIALYADLVELAGIAPNTNRVQCPKARLVIFQWLLRLRADRDHRIYAVGELFTEVQPLARLVYRAERIKPPTPRPTAERNDLPAGHRRNRAETKGATDLRRSTDREGGRRESRGRGETLDGSRSRSRPPLSSSRSRRPVEMLWSLPEILAIELEDDATRPSPAMTTYESIDGEEEKFWLLVSNYVEVLSDVIESDRDWEIVSYVLCHLPLQLANKHFFCGPKSKMEIRRLVLVVCNAINDDRLCNNMDALLPPELSKVDVQGLLYQTLTMLISYHKLFDTLVGDYDQNAKSTKSDIVEVIFQGLAKDEVTNKPCLEALSLAVYELPDQVAKFTGDIVDKLSRIMSSPDMAVHILELLVIIGYTPRLYSGSFREIDYKRVFHVALIYIEHHYRPDGATLQTTDGRESFSLAQHVLNTAFFVIYIWFLAIKLDDRPKYASYITQQLLFANNKKEKIEPSTEVCLDWLARYTYSNADPKSAPSFLYRSIVAPDVGEYSSTRTWDDQHELEMKNVTSIKAWKLGNSIVTVSTMKKPPGWVRIVSRRASGLTELVCRLENWPHVSPGDFAPDLASMPAAMLADRPIHDDWSASEDSLDVEVEMLNALVHDIFEQEDVIQNVQKPDPISGYVWSGVTPSQRRKDVTVDPTYFALLLSAYPSGNATRPVRFPDFEALKGIIRSIDYTPVIDTHKVGIIYVAPGQTTEEEILSNQHGSPAYTRFLADLGRVIKPSPHLEVYTGGLRPETHGEYAYAWWDDMSQIIYHVATIMPNINECRFKKGEIGNDGVKIVWNDGGKPFGFNTINSQFSLINVVVEPHSIGARSAYSDSQHENEFFRVTLQTGPKLPRITPIGELGKIVSAEKLSLLLRHFTLLASLFCNAWVNTGMDEVWEDAEGNKQTSQIPLQTNWQQRLHYIRGSMEYLPNKPAEEEQHKDLASRDFTLSY